MRTFSHISQRSEGLEGRITYGGEDLCAPMFSHDRSCYYAAAVEVRVPEIPSGVSESSTDGRRARGDRTRRAILDEAVQIASAEGLEGLSIGRLAEALGVSKSGLFAHFGSKLDLQVETVRAAREVFMEEVLGSVSAGGGIEEILSLTDAWLDYMEREVFRGGCFLVAASVEFDSRPGPVRDEIAGLVSEWLMALEAAVVDAQEAGHVSREVDAQQLAFELHSLCMGANWAFQLYRDSDAFERARSAIRRRLSGPSPLEIEVDEGAARQTLRGQIAKLERELATLFPTVRPGDELDWRVRSPAGPRVLDVGDLEALRDDLADRVEEIRRALRERTDAEQQKRVQLEAIAADPAGHKWQRLSNEDIGEPGCKHYHSTPRLGLVGMLLGWWRVKVSSGCP
jgi:AcrR family transcriptional regulator